MSEKSNKNISIYDASGALDLASLVSGEILGETKKVRKKKRAISLVDGKRYGYLTFHREEPLQAAGGLQYKCECECGSTIYLSRAQIIERHKMKAGCLSFDCLIGSEEMKAYYTPEVSIRLQLTHLLKADPTMVANEWGGTAYEGSDSATRHAGMHCAMTSLLPKVEVSRRAWWMSRLNPVLPYAEFNVVMQEYPEFRLFGDYASFVMYEDHLYSVEQLATIYKLSLATVKRWRRELIDDTTVMQLILREGTHDGGHTDGNT
jgi:hypothetical protein